MVRVGRAAVRAGNQLLVFPEGTRTRQHRRYGFKGGFALIAKSAGVPVQTVFIETNSRFLGKGWPLFRKPVFPLVYRVRLGAASRWMPTSAHGPYATLEESTTGPGPRPMPRRGS